MAFNVFVDHQDWPANNNRRFLAKAVGSKWKWISFDYDFTVGLFQATGGFNTGDPSPNALKRLLDPNFVFFNNGAWSTLLFRKCWESPQFRRDFSNRLADMMNTLFKANRRISRTNSWLRIRVSINGILSSRQPRVRSSRGIPNLSRCVSLSLRSWWSNPGRSDGGNLQSGGSARWYGGSAPAGFFSHATC